MAEITGELEKPRMATDARRYHQLIGFHQYQGEVGAWAQATFPHATGTSYATHLLYEAVELLIAEVVSAAPELYRTDLHERTKLIAAIYEAVDHQIGKSFTDPTELEGNTPEESADVALLLLAYCAHKGISLAGAMIEKFEVNKLRQYGDPNAQGVSEHRE